ncbi:hypothetical protein [Methylorubrum extorquens]|uniref:hypothetical protein n=1 Tax=Methylorubrum extorquens TaxID=408 RepID=UPI0024BB6A17|nr:hypothetical protein [Methylorubrum extorquens]
MRRFGWNCWQATKDHVSSRSFAADVQAGRWSLALADQSYIGGPGGDTFWHTPGGINALLTVVLKAVKPIALAQRRNTYEWSVPFEDIVASGLSTEWRARIEADDVDLPGGWAEGKVVSLTVKDSAGAGGYPKATIRIASCDGTGEAGEAGELTVGYTGQPWDRVAIAEFAGYPPAPGPVQGGEAYLENGVADQLAYVQAHDYRRDVPGRNDANTDPKQILRKVPTKIVSAMNPIAGGSGIQSFYPLAVSAWPGPRQCNPPSPDA